jgi:tetratricopeptide (TPR) repeat protein
MTPDASFPSRTMPPDDKFQRASSLHRNGDLAGARQIYHEILRDRPGHFGALHLSGVIASQTGNPRLAIQLIWKAIEVDRAHPGARCDLGTALRQLGELDAALASYERAIALDGNSADAFSNRGVVLTELKRFDAALESLDRALELRPHFAAAHFNRGNVFKLQGKFAAALESYDRAIAVNPGYLEAHYNKGSLQQSAGRWEAALSSYEQALAIQPAHVMACINRGIVLKELGELQASLASFDRALGLDARSAEAWSNRGVLLGQLKRFDSAIESFDRALSIRPRYAEALSNKGNTLREMDRIEEALVCYTQAIELDEGCTEAHGNLGVALTELRRLEAALASYDRAIALRPDYAEAYLNRGMALLLLGRFARGWKDYEWRRQRTGRHAAAARRDFAAPMWLGEEPIAGKRILLWWEQGLGDTLHFCRYARLLGDRGARVILEVQPQLAELLEGLSGVEHLASSGETLPPFDFHCPLMSLPMAFGTTAEDIPFSEGYIENDAATVDRWRAVIGESSVPRIGLAWSGSEDNRNDRRRSISLAELLQFLPPEFQYVSLQKDVREGDRPALVARPDIRDLGVDFRNTAAVAECLDLVISVDTSVAHLSAAIGKETWIPLSFNADWRWLLEREDSPWYRAVRLYRQETAGDWRGALSRLRADLYRRFSSV